MSPSGIYWPALELASYRLRKCCHQKLSVCRWRRTQEARPTATTTACCHACTSSCHLGHSRSSWLPAPCTRDKQLSATPPFLPPPSTPHPGTLDAAGNLALTRSRQGRHAEAEELELEVLEASRRVRGAGHPETLRAAGNLATTHDNLGKHAKAAAVRALYSL